MTDGAAKTFHFDLFEQLQSARLAGEDVPLTFHVGGDVYPLEAHTPTSLATARQSNSALACIPAEFGERITHFAEVPYGAVSTERLTHLQVTTPHPDPDVYLPSLLLVSFYVPEPYRLRHLRRRMEMRGDNDVPSKLQRYGVEELPRTTAAAEEVWLAAAAFQTPAEIATALLCHHPQLGSSDPYTATIILEDHIGTWQNNQALYDLSMEIQAQGQGGWSTVTAATDQSGRVLSFEFDLGDRRRGDRVEIYRLSERTCAAMEPALAVVLRSASADERLRGRAWSSQPGLTAFYQPDVQPSRASGRSSGLRWTLEDFTPDHGISANASSIKLDGSKRFSIEVKNHHMRTVCAYAQFFDDGGRVLTRVEPWDSQLDPSIPSYETSGKKYLRVVAPRGSVMGVPLGAPKAELAFRFPDDAASVRLLFGGLGTSRWDADVVIPGVILTGIFNYAIPTLFLVSTAGLEETKWLTDVLIDVGQQTAAVLAGAAVMGEDALPDAMGIMLIFAEAIGGVLVSKGLEKLAAKLTAKMTASQIAGAIPFVGWAFKAALMAAGGAALAITTVQVLSSPATLRVDVKREMELLVTLKPDPAHGEAGKPETAVWPAVASHYHVTVQYLGGTSFVQRGAMPETTSSDPLVLRFPGIPAGGWLRIFAGIYSENDWLCGRWESADLRALPPAGGGPMTVQDAIEELKVPLTVETQYQYKEKVAYDTGSRKHVWRTGSKPTATLADLSCASVGSHLCEVHSLAFNGSAYQIGYSWRASNQGLPLCGAGSSPATQQVHTFQNLSVLADPESRLKFPSCALSAATVVAYDQFVDQSRPDVISQRNFFLDTRVEPYHLRQLLLNTSGSTVDLGAPNLRSWGVIPLRKVDALAVHPHGYVIAASWADHKLAFLELPATGVPDAQAPPAELTSGRGVLPGLVQGPKALTVTPDGRIIVLETINRRLQAFDTKGNAVPCFDGEELAAFDAAGILADLDAGVFSAALHHAFHAKNLTTYRCDIARSFTTTLNSKNLTVALREALALEGIRLSHDPQNPTDPTSNAVIEVVTAGSAWRIVDAAQECVYAISLRGSALAVRDELTDVTITVHETGQRWIITDHATGNAYHLKRNTAKPAEITVLAYRSFLPLAGTGDELIYLDVAAEAEGYLYVLSHKGDGRSVTDYNLDIYEPNGRFLTRTVGLNAARIAVDLWRSLYALTFEKLAGPGGRTEPTIAHWTPTPPRP